MRYDGNVILCISGRNCLQATLSELHASRVTRLAWSNQTSIFTKVDFYGSHRGVSGDSWISKVVNSL